VANIGKLVEDYLALIGKRTLVIEEVRMAKR